MGDVKELSWEDFEKTGKIEDYLKYKGLNEEEKALEDNI